jgi:hypothetical protein
MRCNRYSLAVVLSVGIAMVSWAVPMPQVEPSTPKKPPAAAPAPSGPLNVTIQGEVRGQVPLERIRPPLEAPLKNLIELSRNGKTEKVLKESVGYLGLPEQMKLIKLESPLARQGVLGRIPTYPFFVVRNPVYKSAGVSKIVFQVLDAANQVLKEAEVPVSQLIVTWDGYGPTGQFALKARDVYLPIFQVTRADGQVSTLAGDGVRFEALRYKVNGETMIEIYNGSLYPEDMASFTEMSAAALREIFDDLRVHSDSPFEVTIDEQPRYQDLAKERADLWRQRLAQELLRPADSFTVRVEDAGDRGAVTRIHRLSGGAHP